MGRLSNGDLLAEAERAGFDILLTADKNIRHQQNMTGRHIANPSESERTGVVDANQHYRRLFSIEHNVSQQGLWPAWLFLVQLPVCPSSSDEQFRLQQ